jgi:hypothetical protein
MYVLEYLIYHLKPFGIQNQLQGTAAPPPDHDLKATPWAGPSDWSENKNKTNTSILPKSKSNIVCEFLTSFCMKAKKNIFMKYFI